MDCSLGSSLSVTTCDLWLHLLFLPCLVGTWQLPSRTSIVRIVPSAVTLIYPGLQLCKETFVALAAFTATPMDPRAFGSAKRPPETLRHLQRRAPTLAFGSAKRPSYILGMLRTFVSLCICSVLCHRQ